MPTEYYERTHQHPRIHPIERNAVSQTSDFRFSRLLLKQLAAATIFTLCIYGAAQSNISFFNHCADAFGRAIRYETDFVKIKDQILDFLPNPFLPANPPEVPAETSLPPQ